jgi:hypothetical protein
MKAKAKKPTTPKQSPAERKLAAHNELRTLAGLAVVAAPVRSDPELSASAKLSRIHGKTAKQVIDVLYEGEGPSPPTATVIHWWGQFSDELPAPFKLTESGHGFLATRDLAHAAILFGRLRAAVLEWKTRKKRTQEWAGVSDAGHAWYRWMLGDGRQMTVEFKKPAQLSKLDKSHGVRRAR